MYNLQRDPITLPRRVPRERDVRVDTARQLAPVFAARAIDGTLPD